MKFAAGLKGATFDGSSRVGPAMYMVPLSEHAFAWVLPQIVQSAMAAPLNTARQRVAIVARKSLVLTFIVW
jgi:hypothetical protein